jgi:hypothetical protein
MRKGHDRELQGLPKEGVCYPLEANFVGLALALEAAGPGYRRLERAFAHGMLERLWPWPIKFTSIHP